MPTSSFWAIEARAFLIPLTPFTHNFWVITDHHRQIVDQLHGLAFDPATGTTRAIGSSKHLLQVIRDAAIAWSLQPNQPAVIAAAGLEEGIKRRWQASLNALPALNALKLPYPDLWQHAFKPNSNSVFNTLGKIMGFEHPGKLLPTWAPGMNLTIAPDIIARFAYSDRVV